MYANLWSAVCDWSYTVTRMVAATSICIFDRDGRRPSSTPDQFEAPAALGSWERGGWILMPAEFQFHAQCHFSRDDWCHQKLVTAGMAKYIGLLLLAIYIDQRTHRKMEHFWGASDSWHKRILEIARTLHSKVHMWIIDQLVEMRWYGRPYCSRNVKWWHH